MRLFWVPEDLHVPTLRLNEAIPILVLLSACVLLTARAGSVMAYLEDTAWYLDQPGRYVEAVLGQDPHVFPAPAAGHGGPR